MAFYRLGQGQYCLIAGPTTNADSNVELVEIDDVERFPKPFFNLLSFDNLDELLVLSNNIEKFNTTFPKKYSKIIDVITFVLSYNSQFYNMNIETKNFYKNK